MVFYAHAESVDQDGSHDGLVKVFTFHNRPQGFPEIFPGVTSFTEHELRPSKPISDSSFIALLGMKLQGHVQIYDCFALKKENKCNKLNITDVYFL